MSEELEPGWVTLEIDPDQVRLIVEDGKQWVFDRVVDGVQFRFFVSATGLDTRSLDETYESTPDGPATIKIHPHLAKCVVNRDHTEQYPDVENGVAFAVDGEIVDAGGDA